MTFTIGIGTLILVAVLGVASYRITRFFLFDSIVENLRQHWYMFLVNRKHFKWLTVKLLDLTSCSWCLGAHISWIVLSLWTSTWPWQLGVKGWIVAAAIAGVQGPAHAWEPNDDHDDH